MVRTKTNTQNDTSTRRTLWRNENLEKMFLLNFEVILIFIKMIFKQKMLRTKHTCLIIAYDIRPQIDHIDFTLV